MTEDSRTGGCNARLGTWTETDDVVVELDDFWVNIGKQVWKFPDGVGVVRRGDRLMRLDLHTVTCSIDHVHSMSAPHHFYDSTTMSSVTWDNMAPGAVPHTPPAVTDAHHFDVELDNPSETFTDDQLEAAEREMVYAYLRGETPAQIVASMRRAAARVREGQQP